MAMPTTRSPWFIESAPELGERFAAFHEACLEEGALDEKTKQLLMAALACVFRCPHCVEEHIRDALKAGASKKEVTEALLLAAVEGAGTQLAWNEETFMKYLSP